MRRLKSKFTRRAREWKGAIAVQFSGDKLGFLQTLSLIKSIDGRLFHKSGNYWTLPLSIPNIDILTDNGFRIDKGLQKIRKKRTTIKIPSDFHIPGLKRTLKEFQREGAYLIDFYKGRALLADDMGLGKTIQALSYLQLHPKKRPAIIVSPASLKLNWLQEITMTLSTKDSISVLESKSPSKIVTDIAIINYDILDDWKKQIISIKPKVIITDECHKYKNSGARRTKAVKFISKGCPHFIAISGTPVEKSPSDMYNAIKIINPFLFPNYFEFGQKFCDATHNGYGWNFNGASNTKELHSILISTIMIRRLKRDVLPELPGVIKSHVPMSLDSYKEYQKVENNFIEYVKNTRGNKAAEKASNAEALVQLAYLKQAAVRGKLKSTLDWVTNFLESGEKLVVFAVGKEVIAELTKAFAGICVKIDGSVNMNDRNLAVQRFQTDERIRLFIGNIEAAGEGLTLTAASNVAFVELPSTSRALEQAIARCDRIGQKFTVNAYMLLAKDTIDERMAAIIDRNKKVIDSVMDGEDTASVNLLTELMDSYRLL